MILAYLCENPDAEDTLEGIVEWWLLAEDIKWRTTEVRQALRTLTANGYVLEKCGAEGRIRYRINRERLEEIQRGLQKPDGEPEQSENDESGH
jgi:hypothetical protein